VAKVIPADDYEQIYDGQWFKFGEGKSNRRDVIACCDCGLVHEFKLKMRKGKDGEPEVFMMANRMPDNTAHLRRTTPQKKK
jgi:hypothetical protein